MSARLTNVEFAEEGGFELAAEYGGRNRVEQRFAELRDELLAGELEETRTVGLHRGLKQAANEAAAIAWSTEYPLLVFPGLFAEIARRERLRADRQQRIFARSEELMSHAV